jgi:cytochrome P450
VRAVLNETLRLFAPVPANVRSSKDAVAIPVKPYGKSTDTRPIYIAAEKTVVFFPFLIHRRKDLWGPDADEFDPNRWLDDGTGRLERMIRNPLMFVPFNAGPRIVSRKELLVCCILSELNSVLVNNSL